MTLQFKADCSYIIDNKSIIYKCLKFKHKEQTRILVHNHCDGFVQEIKSYLKDTQDLWVLPNLKNYEYKKCAKVWFWYSKGMINKLINSNLDLSLSSYFKWIDNKLLNNIIVAEQL